MKKQELGNEDEQKQAQMDQEEVISTEEEIINEGSSTEEDNVQENSTKDELSEMKDKYLRLYSEFENFRRRTAREKLDVIQTANADLLTELLPVLDDLDRALQAMDQNNKEEEAVQKGFQLIYNKFNKTLVNAGVKEIEAKEGTIFDVEVHEAVSQIPAPTKKLKGKIIAVVEKGYYLKEKVIRFSKVVVGS